MNINPYKMMRAYIDKQDGMLKLYVPDIIKDVEAEIDYYDLIIRIK
nr:MAG TPA: hypothetical protein [Caudoviricetes sp.]